MTDDQLAELEMHLAAGTDLPTALAAIQPDQPTRPTNRRAFDAGLVIGLLVGLAVLWWLGR